MSQEADQAFGIFAGLMPGRIVHYVPDRLPVFMRAGECWAALVCRVLDQAQGIVVLKVTREDGSDHVAGPVKFAETHLPGTWHWTPRS